MQIACGVGHAADQLVPIFSPWELLCIVKIVSSEVGTRPRCSPITPMVLLYNKQKAT